MLSVDLKAGKLHLNDEIKLSTALKRPYERWTEDSVVNLG